MDQVRISIEGARLEDIGESVISTFLAHGIHARIGHDEDKFDEFFLSAEAASIVVSGVAFLSALINALFVFIGSRRSGRVTIVSASGRKIEFDSDTPREKIDDYISIASQMDEVNRVKLHL